MPIPTPEAGLVISYSYLWHFEHQIGKDEGRKTRPVAIVLTTRRKADEAFVVTVLPITHSAPSDPTTAIEIPAPVKRHLGLDDARSWIVINEGNEFDWPGYDMRKVPGTDHYDYGFLPRRFFATVVAAFVHWHTVNKGHIALRT